MSFETVIEKCKHLHPEANEEYFVQALEADLIKQITKFEKIVKSWGLQGQDSMFRSILKEGQTVSQIKNEYFEKQKQYYVVRYITMLCDYYDIGKDDK